MNGSMAMRPRRSRSPSSNRFTDPDHAARKRVEIANTLEAVQDGRIIHIELVNGRFLKDGGTPDQFRTDGVLGWSRLAGLADAALQFTKQATNRPRQTMLGGAVGEPSASWTFVPSCSSAQPSRTHAPPGAPWQPGRIRLRPWPRPKIEMLPPNRTGRTIFLMFPPWLAGRRNKRWALYCIAAIRAPQDDRAAGTRDRRDMPVVVPSLEWCLLLL